MGLSTKPPAKPESIKALEQTEMLGVPFVAGGLMDQPHIWMMEYKIAHDERTRWQALLVREGQETGDAPKHPRF